MLFRSGENEMTPPGLGIFLNDFGAGDVGRHQVRRELNPRKFEIEDLRHRVDEERLREPGDADDETVAAGEQRQQYELDRVLLANDELAQLCDDRVVPALETPREIEVVLLEICLWSSDGGHWKVRSR